MKITINIEKVEKQPIEYELDCYGQWSKTEYSEDEVIINIHEKEEDKPKTKYENKKGMGY